MGKRPFSCLDLISQQTLSQTRTLLTDGLGSVRTEMVGSAIHTLTTYEPFGKVFAQTGSSGTVYGFTGEQFDSTTGLLYLRARYYNPALHGFMTRDSWGGLAQRPQTFNPYSYVGGNVINLTDPSGNCYPPIEFLRGVEPTNCSNLDMAIQVVRHPEATFAQRAAANTYIVAWAGSHAGLVAGTVGLGVGGAAAIAEWGMMYVATHAPGLAYAYPAVANAFPVAVTAWSLLDDAVTAYGAATGNPQAQQAAVVAQQIGQLDGSLPLFDGIGGLYACGSQALTHALHSPKNYDGPVDLLFQSLFRSNSSNLPGSTGIPISRRLTPNEMATLTLQHKVEFALIYKRGHGFNGGGGQYILYSGTANSVSVPHDTNNILIYHTHPAGSLTPSAADINRLDFNKAIGSPQRKSSIIPVSWDSPLRLTHFWNDGRYTVGLKIYEYHP